VRKSLVLISVGVLNLLHGLFHIIQFIQSMMLVAYSTHHEPHDDSWLDAVLHSPVLAIIWAVIGILTMVIGIRDYRHHRKCAHEHKH
jgi:uncharacterized membrane protein YvlD (DUF360 family)